MMLGARILMARKGPCSAFRMQFASNGTHFLRVQNVCVHDQRIRFFSRGRDNAQSKPTIKIEGTDNTDNGSLKTVRRLLPNVWPKGDWKTKGTVVAALAMLVGGKVMNIYVPFFFKAIVDEMSIVDMSRGLSIYDVGGATLLGYGLARITTSFLSEFKSAMFAGIAQRAVRRVAVRVFDNLLRMDSNFHLRNQTGGLTRAIDRGAKGISQTMTAAVFHIVPTALEISLVCGILTYNFGPSFALVTASTMAMYSVYTIKTTSWRTKFRRQANVADNESASLAVDSLTNHDAVQYFNNRAFEVDRYNKAYANYERSAVKISTSLATLNFGQNVVFSLGLTAMMWLAAEGILKGSMTVGDLVLVNQLLFQLSVPLNFLGSVYRDIRQSLIDMGTLFRLEEVRPAIQNDPTLPGLQVRRGDIEFRNVTFSYVNGRPPILKNASFTIPGGKRVAIVGPSGCGKSTVFRLIFRLFDPESGQVLIDGQDISQISLDSLRLNVGIVPQDTTLFHDTILHNVRYGRLSATDDEVRDALEKAHVWNTVASLPDGWHTEVGERGLLLSGGEKQRIALARVLLKDAPVIVYDEATSALDAETEMSVMANIRAALATNQRTSVFIAHRLKAIADADWIIVLKDGAVAEQGTHAQLMAKNGMYRHYWDFQTA